MDFFTVPTASLRLLYVFFVIEHGRRQVLHFNASFNPTAASVIQQLREAFPYDTPPRYLLFDRDLIVSAAVVSFVKAMGRSPCRTLYRSPWQNPVAQRRTGSCRRELLHDVVTFGQRHLVRLMRCYISYHHEDRCHLGLGKDTSHGRPVTSRPAHKASHKAKVVGLPRVAGLHHRHEWREAA